MKLLLFRFTLDEMDPSHFDGEEVDYEIMSKGYV